MTQGEPKWWKVVLKDPSSWLIILSIVAILGTSLTMTIFEKKERKDIKPEIPIKVEKVL